MRLYPSSPIRRRLRSTGTGGRCAGRNGFGWILLVFLTTPCLGIRCHAQRFIYSDFAAPTQLILQGDVEPYANRLRLTPAVQRKRSGVWFQTKQPVGEGFQSIFQFQITAPCVYGGQGLAFMMQGNATPLLSSDVSGDPLGPRGFGQRATNTTPLIGGLGRTLGFVGISNAVVIKFGTYHWNRSGFVKFDEISVIAGDEPSVRLSNAYRIASVTNAVFSDQKIHTVKVAYVPGTLQIFLDDLEHPRLTVPLNLATVMNLEQGRAWVGFTSSTGGDCQNHDLVSWSFASLNNPVTLAAQPVAAVPTPARTSLTATPTFAATEQSPVLPHDKAFGYAVPAQVGLTHRIEASTDLVHWVTITNVAIYFKDYESTNYDRRFYRFLDR